MDLSNLNIDQIIDMYGEDLINDYFSKDLTVYQSNPIDFLQKELGVKNLYSDLIDVANSVRDNKITVAMSSNGTGKTFIASRLAAWFYLCFPDSQVICAAAPPEENLKQGLFSEISNVYYKYRSTLFKKHTITTLRITDEIDLKDEDSEINKGHFLVGRAIPLGGTPEKRKAAFSGKHAKYQLFIVDEADGCPDEIFEAIDGCLSGTFVRLLCLFNPRQKVGYVHSLYKKRDAGACNLVRLNAFNHPNVVTGKDIIPGAVSRDKTIQRIYEWTKPLGENDDPDSSCFEIPEYLVGAVGLSNSGTPYPPLQGGWRRITISSFSTIVLGEYPSTLENSLISEVDIDRAVSNWKLYNAQYGKDATKGLNCVLGMDVADEGGDSCAVCKKYGNYVAGFETWKGIDVDKSSDKLAKIYVDLDAYQANVEADGIGAAIPPKVSRIFYHRCENKECEGYKNTYIEEHIFKCPICQKDMQRCHINVRKVYVSSPSEKKCDLGKFDKLRDQLAWDVAEWLKKEPSAMLPDDQELREELLAFEYYEDPNSGKIKVTDKKSLKKKIGRSDDKFAALRQAIFVPAIPKIRLV